MREEESERIYVHSKFFAKWVLDQQGIDPELVIKLGEPVPEILAQVRDDPEIGVLVLGAGAGNLQNFLVLCQYGPPLYRDLSKENLEAIT